MSDIPQDIREKATNIARDLMGGSWFIVGIEPISMALMSERERCAKIAEGIGADYGEDENGWLDCSETIARAIRRT